MEKNYYNKEPYLKPLSTPQSEFLNNLDESRQNRHRRRPKQRLPFTCSTDLVTFGVEREDGDQLCSSFSSTQADATELMKSKSSTVLSPPHDEYQSSICRKNLSLESFKISRSGEDRESTRERSFELETSFMSKDDNNETLDLSCSNSSCSSSRSSYYEDPAHPDEDISEEERIRRKYEIFASSDSGKSNEACGPKDPAGENSQRSEEALVPISTRCKEVMKSRIVCAVAFEAFRRQRDVNKNIHKSLEKKKEEVAARLILHNLLLNSWRIKTGELSFVKNENSQLHKKIDKLCLQLRVVRHIQTTEKEKNASLVKQFDSQTVELAEVKKDYDSMRIELEKVSKEREDLLHKIQLLEKEHNLINSKYTSLKETRENLMRSAEFKKEQVEKFQEENSSLAKEIENFKSQLQQLTKQSSHWQEKARAYESECWELKLHIETKDSKVSALRNEKQKLSRENEILAVSKKKTEDQLRGLKDALALQQEESKCFKRRIEESYNEIALLEDKISDLNADASHIRAENESLRHSLNDYAARNVRKRRNWGVLFYIFNPLEMFRAMYFGSSGLHNFPYPHCGSTAGSSTADK